MTDKQIIIDYKNLCENYSKEVGCFGTFDGSCIKEQCFTYKLLQQLQAKEQECERLEEELYYWVNGEYCDNECNVVKELDQLKTENEELKEIQKLLKEQMAFNKNELELNWSSEIKRCEFLLNEFKKVDKQRDNWRQQAEKLNKTLTEIKEICNNNDELKGDFNLVDCDKYKLGKHNLANRILQKISECEE